MDMVAALTLHLVRRRQMGRGMGVHGPFLGSFGKLYGVAMALETELCGDFFLRGVLLVATLAGNAAAFVLLSEKSASLSQTRRGIKCHGTRNQQKTDHVDNCG